MAQIKVGFPQACFTENPLPLSFFSPRKQNRMDESPSIRLEATSKAERQHPPAAGTVRFCAGEQRIRNGKSNSAKASSIPDGDLPAKKKKDGDLCSFTSWRLEPPRPSAAGGSEPTCGGGGVLRDPSILRPCGSLRDSSSLWHPCDGDLTAAGAARLHLASGSSRGGHPMARNPMGLLTLRKGRGHGPRPQRANTGDWSQTSLRGQW